MKEEHEPRNNGGEEKHPDLDSALRLAKAAAFGKAVAEGGNGEAADIYLWEHGMEVEPWPEPVDIRVLLDDLEFLLKRYVVLPQWGAETLALWVVHTYAFSLRDVATYIGIESPEKRCGKTTALTVLCELVNRPVVASNISSPAFYRVIAEKKPTMVIDEGDTVLHRNRELRGILNAGYAKKTAYVIRVTAQKAKGGKGGSNGEAAGAGGVPGGGNGNGAGEAEAGQDSTDAGMQLGRFSSWCPKVIATIKHLPEILADRCIVLRMQRKSPREKCERLRTLEGEELRRKCARWVMDHAEEIANATPEFPEDLNDRAADIWEPLLAIADLAGSERAEKARKAALGLTAMAQEESPIVALLLDLFIMFVRERTAEGNGSTKDDGGVRMFSRDIVATLNAYTDRPWMVLRRGKEVTETWLSQQLRGYGLRPRTIWIGERSAKGYMEEDFTEVFRRYLPKSAVRALLDESLAAHRERLKDDGGEEKK